MPIKPPLQIQLPFRNCGQCLRPRYLQPTASARSFTTSPLRFNAKPNPLRNRAKVRSQKDEAEKYRRSIALSAAGIAACAVAMYGVIKLDLFGLEQQQPQAETQDSQDENKDKSMKMDGPDGFTSTPSVIRIQGQDGVEKVETGTSSVPHFPATIRLPRYADKEALAKLAPGDEIPGAEEEEEYQLLGLGIRTVSFLRIQVYVVGMYVAKSDISELQQRLMQMAVNPPSEEQVISNSVGATSATMLVSTERQRLKELLLDGKKGEEAWNAILKQPGLRTAIRIVPTRNTDYQHLRDAWVRGITGKAQKANAKAKAAADAGKTIPNEFNNESFGLSVTDFKRLVGAGQQKNLPKGQAILLLRNSRGELDALAQPHVSKPWQIMGHLDDERISRLVWMIYLAGKNVSSEPARQSVVDGIMGIVERPIGTVVQKVL
ncbi:chalcone-flavanone isomerase-domain-containing protein [Aspergillus unguis]